MKKKQQPLVACAVSAALALTALGLPATAYANTEPVINASTETVRQSWESVYGESLDIQIVDGRSKLGFVREDGNLWIRLGNADPEAELYVAEQGAGTVVRDETGWGVWLVIAPEDNGYAGLRLVFKNETGTVTKWAVGWMITRVATPPAPEPVATPSVVTPPVITTPTVQPPKESISSSRVEKKTVRLTANSKLSVVKKTASKVTLRATVSGAKGYVQAYDSKTKTWKTVRTVKKSGTTKVTLKRSTAHRYYRVVSQRLEQRKVVIRNGKNFSVTYVTDYITSAKTSGKVLVKGMPKVTIKKSGKTVKVKSTHAGTVKVTGHKVKKIKANRTYTFKLKAKKNSVVVKVKSSKTTDALTVKRTVKR